MAKSQQERIIFGLKIRQARQEKGWNFDELSRRTGISVSYLNEIEKGKKFPQPENLSKLAAAFEVAPEFLTSPELSKHLAPLGDLLQSNFLNELPLDLFGIEVQQVVEIIARAPDRVNAFISAMLEIARNYSLREENFFHAALRAYQELRMNYFEEIEQAAADFVKKHGLPTEGSVEAEVLAEILKSEFRCKTEWTGLNRHPELRGLRSVTIPRRKRLLLNGKLNPQQRAFQIAKEIGFRVLELEERPYTSNLLKINSFDEVLNNYKAAYFAVAVLVNRDSFVRDIHGFLSKPTWQPQFLGALLEKYRVSPEVMFQRFGVLSREFKLPKVFFQRFIHDLDRNSFELDKELHLNRKHHPHASGLNEHYCRRWLVVDLLQKLQLAQNQQLATEMLPGIQITHFFGTDEKYLTIAVAKSGQPIANRNVGIAFGILIDDDAQRAVQFLNDPKIQHQTVNVTCERCAVENCAQRAAKASVLEKREERRRAQVAVNQLIGVC